MFFWLIFPAITMSLGWGLRGFIGGGPLGAMIPGAMVALSLCLLLRRSAPSTLVVAALAAAGVGFGGQETYGNTIQLAIAEETRAWGLLGLTVKGAVWGLLGGAVIGLALQRGRIHCLSLGAMIAGTWAGWAWINVPRQFGYFSIDRGELWAGLLLGALALLAVERSPIAWRFALIAALGGGFGFGFGGWLQVWGRWNAPHAWVGWWKVMEFFFGFCFGLALGWAAWRWRTKEPATTWGLGFDWLALPAIGLALYLEYTGEFRFLYTLLGAGLIALVGWRSTVAWAMGMSMTMAAFTWDLTHSAPAAAAMALAVTCARFAQSPLHAFLLLTWSANTVATIKATWRGEFHGEHAMFLLMGVAITWMAIQYHRQDDHTPRIPG